MKNTIKPKERISKITGKPVQKRNYTKKTGHPSKFSPEIQRQAKILAAKGFTDKEMAQVFDVKEQTLNNWKNAHPKFFESLKDEKAKADAKVVKSLYERACGYNHPEDKIFNNNGEPLIVPTIKHYPPDPVSMIFWLKNRQRDEWKDGKHLDVTGELGIKNVTDKQLELRIANLERKLLPVQHQATITHEG